MRELFKDFTNSVVRNVSSQTNTNVLQRFATQLLFIPLYHAVSNEKLPHTTDLYHVRDQQTFIDDLDYLLKHYEPVGIKDIHEHVTLRKIITKPSFHVTVDDGMKECIDVMAPILKNKGVPATFFINSAFVDNKEMCYLNKASLIIDKINNNPLSEGKEKEIEFHLIKQGLVNGSIPERLIAIDYKSRDVMDKIAGLMDINADNYLKTRQPYLSSSDIASLKTDGFNIGAHSIDHPNYEKLDYDEQISQTTVSLDYVNSTFKTDHSLFAFPFSDTGISLNFFKRMFNPEKPVTDLTFGTSGIRRDIHPAHLHRSALDKNNLPAKQLINAEYIKYLIRRSMGRVQIRRS